MSSQRETPAPRPEAGTTPSPAPTSALTPAEPGLRTSLRSLGARAALLTATVLPVAVGPFFLTSAAVPVDNAAASLQSAVGYDEVEPFVLAERELRASRSSAPRVLSAVTLEPRPIDQEWATAPLNVWERPGERGKRFGVLKDGSKVAVTGQTEGRWAEALVNGKARWVNADYLAETKPKPPAASSGTAAVSGISTAPCADGSGTESGLTSNAVMMFRAICAAFPALTTYGGYDGHGEHADGRAVDFMTYSNSALGNAVAEWARANAGALNIRTIIWAQKIWTPERASEGWRYMPDRGSATANHYDHPHISVY